MRIGIVVDSACDLPPAWLEAHDVKLLPVTVRIGDTRFVDLRDERATLDFVDAHVAERGHTAETAAYPSDRIKALFLDELVIEYDYVFCLTVTRHRSQIHDNATHASFAILNEYKPIRAAAGHATPFALRIVDSQQVFAGQGILPVEAVRLRDAALDILASCPDTVCPALGAGRCSAAELAARARTERWWWPGTTRPARHVVGGFRGDGGPWLERPRPHCADDQAWYVVADGLLWAISADVHGAAVVPAGTATTGATAPTTDLPGPDSAVLSVLPRSYRLLVRAPR